jgi:hypothetical protein
MPQGSVMPSSLHLVGVVERPEELTEEAENPRQLPGHSRGPPGGNRSFAVRSQCLLQPVQIRLTQHLLSPLFQDLQAHRSVHLRASSLLRCEILRSALTHLYRGSGWRRIGQKLDWGGGDSRARAVMDLPALEPASYAGHQAPTIVTPPETDTERIGATLIRSPSVEERPAKQWPRSGPPRAARIAS